MNIEAAKKIAQFVQDEFYRIKEIALNDEVGNDSTLKEAIDEIDALRSKCEGKVYPFSLNIKGFPSSCCAEGADVLFGVFYLLQKEIKLSELGMLAADFNNGENHFWVTSEKYSFDITLGQDPEYREYFERTAFVETLHPYFSDSKMIRIRVRPQPNPILKLSSYIAQRCSNQYGFELYEIENENCTNIKDCACPKTKCKNHGKCCDCVVKHRETGSLPFCLFLDNDGDKSILNYYRTLKDKFEN